MEGNSGDSDDDKHVLDGGTVSQPPANSAGASAEAAAREIDFAKHAATAMGSHDDELGHRQDEGPADGELLAIG